MNKLKLLTIIALLTSCADPATTIVNNTPDAKKNPIIGSFGPSECFYNDEASNGMGSAVYTIVSIQFNADNTGLNKVQLYTTVTDCSGIPDMELDIETVWTTFPNKPNRYVIDQSASGAGAFLATIEVTETHITVDPDQISTILTLDRN